MDALRGSSVGDSALFFFRSLRMKAAAPESVIFVSSSISFVTFSSSTCFTSSAWGDFGCWGVLSLTEHNIQPLPHSHINSIHTSTPFTHQLHSHINSIHTSTPFTHQLHSHKAIIANWSTEHPSNKLIHSFCKFL